MKITRWQQGSSASNSSGGAPSGPAGGDLGGGYPSPDVTGLRGTPICTDTPATSEVLTFNGTEWCPAPVPGGLTGFATPAWPFSTTAADGVATTAVRSDSTVALFDTTVPASTGDANATGSAGKAARRDHVHALGSTAGGDLSGTYPNPTVATVGGQNASAVGNGVHAHVYLEQMTGDGMTTLFYLAQEAVPDQPPEAFVNGVLTDVTLGGMNDTITFGAAPAAAAAIRVNYLAAIF